MAFGLSMWIQLLVTLFFVNLVQWMAAVLGAAQEFDRKVTQEAQHHAAIDEATRFAPIFRVFMLVLWALLGSSGQTVHDVLFYVGVVGVPLLIFFAFVGNWLHVLVLYKARIMKMRRGVYFFDRMIYREDMANFYIGYQVAGMTLSGGFFMASGLVLIVPVIVLITVAMTYQRGAEFIQSGAMAVAPPLIHSLITITLVVVFQLVLNLCVFFVGPRSNKWLRHRWCALSTRPFSTPPPPPLPLSSPPFPSLSGGTPSTSTI